MHNDLSRLLSEFDVLIVPGRDNSGPGHWQTLLEDDLPEARRVQQENWAQPDLNAWSARVAAAAYAADRPVLAVAHSFGCLATVGALLDHAAPLAGALLVAPAEPKRFAIPAHRLQQPLPVPNLLVASRNDPWMSYPVALGWAAHWGSTVIDAGLAGHINVASGHGHWPALPTLLTRLAARAEAAGEHAFPLPFFKSLSAGRTPAVRHPH